MSTVLLKNNKIEYITTEKDLLYLIEEHLGYDIKDWTEEYITNLQEQADFTKQKINTDLQCYEEELADHNSAFSEIIEQIELLKEYVEDSDNKVTRKNILEYIKKIESVFDYYNVI